MKRVLMIAAHYPPMRGSSGVQRTLKFSDYLRQHGWLPMVLTMHPRAHLEVGDEQLGDIPEDVEVRRAFAVDAARHLAVAGRYPRFMASPDRWASWYLGAIPAGLGLIKKYKPEVIWSTFPIATAHQIGLALHKRSGKPWVADFRDSMTEEDFPSDPAVWRTYRKLEAATVRHAARSVFTTPGTRRLYANRYPDVATVKWAEIPNGYDEENFRAAEQRLAPAEPSGPLKLVHSGLLYPSERDPRPFFRALAELRDTGVISARDLVVLLRATGHDDTHRQHIADAGVGDLVQLVPGIPYVDALAEMLTADGLLLFQAANCNHQIPAKLYEYLRAGRPIFALTHPAGDTAATLTQAGIHTIARLDDSADIKARLADFVQQLKVGNIKLPDSQVVASYSRESSTAGLARIFDAVSSNE